MIQHEGDAIRVPTTATVACFRKSEELRDFVLPFINYLMLQISQVASCNRYHSAVQRLARWLLSMHDRCDNDDLTVTQKFLSLMLATRRASIVSAVAELRRAGAISARRNVVRIEDRAALESRACECYRALAREGIRTLGFYPRR